jgi:hypothetical protein
MGFKGVQRVVGCLASLIRFVSCLIEHRLPLYKLLRKTDHFLWLVEAQEALDGLKSLLTRAPILVPPENKELLLHYVAETTKVDSLVLVVERQEGEGVRPLQHTVYFVREVLTSVKARYPQVQKAHV